MSERKRKKKKKLFTPEPGSSFDCKPKPCYTIRIFKTAGNVQILENKSIRASFKLSSFPESLDMNDVETVAGLISLAREKGIESLQDKYELALTKSK